MSVVYEPRTFMHDGSYPAIDDQHGSGLDADRFHDHADVNELASVADFAAPSTFADPDTRIDLGPSPLSKEDSPTETTPQRVKPIPKPDREVTKNMDGKFVCTYGGCTEDVKEFQRKCEWNKHMDKHDRPYKCAAVGCEKLPGFTYSGGLLRHEREVHNKHGGPKNSFHCPHPTCKRHTGKGFSRAENLNEHMRRVHTQNGVMEGESDDGGSDTPAANKRKRDPDDVGDLREEFKRICKENEELRRQVDGQTQQISILLEQTAQLRNSLSMQPSIAPTAPML